MPVEKWRITFSDANIIDGQTEKYAVIYSALFSQLSDETLLMNANRLQIFGEYL